MLGGGKCSRLSILGQIILSLWVLVPMDVAAMQQDISVALKGESVRESNSIAGIPVSAIEAFSQSYLMEKIAKTRVPGVLMVVVDRFGNRFEKGYGHADIALKDPMDSDRHLFRIASESKVFTGIAIMELVEQGKLSLDDDIAEYLGDLTPSPVVSHPVTIRHLLQHTPGISNMKMVGGALRSVEDHPSLEDYLRANPIYGERSPGKSIAYTNGAFTLLGRIIEVVSGQSYEEYMEEHVFRPVGMDRTGFVLPPNLRPDLAEGALIKGDKITRYLAADTVTRPSGDIISSTTDMGNFLIALLNDGEFEGRSLISGKTWKEMTGDCFSAHPWQGGRCLSLRRDYLKGFVRYGHQGSHITHHSTFWVLPSAGLGIWVGGTSNVAFDEEFVDEFLARFLPDSSDIIVYPNYSKGVNDAHQVAGYYLRNAASMERSGKFFHLLQPSGLYKVEPSGDGDIQINGRSLAHIDEFTYQYPEAQRGLSTLGEIITFLKDDDGQAVTLHGDVFSASRIPWYLTPEVNVFYAGIVSFMMVLGGGAFISFAVRRSILLPVIIAGGVLICWLLPFFGIWQIVSMQEQVLYGFPRLFEYSRHLIWLTIPLAIVLCVLTFYEQKILKSGVWFGYLCGVCSLLLVPWAFYWQIA